MEQKNFIERAAYIMERFKEGFLETAGNRAKQLVQAHSASRPASPSFDRHGENHPGRRLRDRKAPEADRASVSVYRSYFEMPFHEIQLRACHVLLLCL